MTVAKNILFIMCDQIRWDYLSCTGHPHLETPNIDALAARGVIFDRAFCQAPVCGPSRASFYTGRYAASHGGNYNNFPLRVDEWCLGDYLKPLGVKTALVGKTHMKPDLEGMSRLGIDPKSDLGLNIVQTGFVPFERDDGLHPEVTLDPDLAYNTYLRELGFDGENPWHNWANSAEGPDGEILSGWHMRHARLPARVPEEHSETAYMTNRAMEFITQEGDNPWCLHLSYIKPHWPYMAPAPYHDLYGPQQVLPANKTEAERANPHPVVSAFMTHGEAECFAEEECRLTVIPTYMGLIRQIDDHLGRLFAFMEEKGRLDDTMIVFTSDHGDYLGDHWLGEKELFHEESVRIPMIIADPSPDADASRGTRNDKLVEAIDLIPTFIDRLGGDIPQHRLEGRSLMPWLQSQEPEEWRDATFAECDFALRHARKRLDLKENEARGFMVRTDTWKFVYFPKFPPQLFNLIDDPAEQNDLGTDPAYETVREDMRRRLLDWFASLRQRTTMSDKKIAATTGKAKERGYLFGVW